MCSTCPPASSLHGCREVYEAASPGYRGRCTAPLVIDKLQRRLVSNESADILRMLNSMQLPGASNVDLYPAEHRAEIDAINDLVYDKVCLDSDAAQAMDTWERRHCCSRWLCKVAKSLLHTCAWFHNGYR